MKKLLKNPLVAGTAAFLVSKALHATLRITTAAHPSYNNKQPYLFAFWHGKQFLPVLQLVQHKTPKVGLVSPSRDGALLEVWLKNLHYDIIRGSSRDGNIRSTVAMIQKLKAGFSVGFGVDGPIGPIYKIKPGILYMAQKCNVPIVPLGSAFSSKWVLEKAWDRYQIPKPCARAGYYIGEPFVVTPDMDQEQARLDLEVLLQQAEATAAELIGKQKIPL